MVNKAFPFLIGIFLFCGYLGPYVNALVDNTGQEIIEVRNPLKDLPTELEEEPSVEKEDVIQTNRVTTAAVPVHTKKDVKSESAAFKKMQARSKSQEDESKIEKEIAELYKDSDYKIETDGLQILRSNSSTKTVNVTSEADTSEESVRANDQAFVLTEKPIVRANKDFKFQPDDINNKAEVERFRTSMDDIVCDRQFTTEKLSGMITSINNLKGGVKNKSSGIIYEASLIIFLLIPLIAMY